MAQAKPHMGCHLGFRKQHRLYWVGDYLPVLLELRSRQNLDLPAYQQRDPMNSFNTSGAQYVLTLWVAAPIAGSIERMFKRVAMENNGLIVVCLK
ncbi:MAG: hypothetical protein WDO18_01985 [Acidobacteriota bacterium]